MPKGLRPLKVKVRKKDEAELAIAFIDQIMISRQGRGIKQNKSLAQFIKDELQAIKRWKYA